MPYSMEKTAPVPQSEGMIFSKHKKTATMKKLILVIGISFSVASCGNNPENIGSSTPIDSTNVKGAAPATYGPNNPANDERDSNRNNTNDTGTKANNVHNAGTYR